MPRTWDLDGKMRTDRQTDRAAGGSANFSLHISNPEFFPNGEIFIPRPTPLAFTPLLFSLLLLFSWWFWRILSFRCCWQLLNTSWCCWTGWESLWGFLSLHWANKEASAETREDPTWRQQRSSLEFVDTAHKYPQMKTKSFSPVNRYLDTLSFSIFFGLWGWVAGAAV